ncbi:MULTISPECIES: GNAT family N-acetyltransferase [Methylobacillus]|uniref:GNAT family N-acetyltransferase n=1 Tax=Methylobacillus TaxID=404 RepID=UPI003862154C
MQYLAVPTGRLVLRQWREADLAPFALLSTDPEVMEYFPGVLDRHRSASTISLLRIFRYSEI